MRPWCIAAVILQSCPSRLGEGDHTFCLVVCVLWVLIIMILPLVEKIFCKCQACTAGTQTTEVRLLHLCLLSQSCQVDDIVM